ncbi:MAG: hypothetical protein WC717_05305 [Candidatus Micrarchaeia archaeon]|jgi:hypothetical protein
MAKEQRDETLGKILGKIPVYKNGLDSSGEIILCESGIIVRADGNTIRAPFSHVKILGKSADLPLGKVGVEMDVFDNMGEKHYFHLGMSDMHFGTLLRACGK